MYKCQICGAQVPRGVRCLYLITKRTKVYKALWVRARNTLAHRARTWRDMPRNKQGGRHNGQPRYIEILVPVHVGWEIAAQRRACAACHTTAGIARSSA